MKRACGTLGLFLGLLFDSFPTDTRAQTAAAAPEAVARLRGRVLDADSQQPVGFAEVWLLETDRHTLADAAGRFAFADIAPRVYALRATRVGYDILLRQGIAVQAGDSTEVQLTMAPRYSRLKAITVTPGAYSFMKTSPTTRQTMSREDIESVPQIGEDVFRAVNRMPGLSSGDYSAHFSIRGGRHDETLILFDGLELYEPYHLKDFNEGAVSIVDVETIDGVQLLTGGFAAQYGNKRSGVFDIASRTPEKDKAHYGAGISFMNGRVMARGPLWGGKGSWLASARSGFMDLVFAIIDETELPSPRYHDAFGKFQVKLNPSHKLTVDVLYAGDSYTFDAPSTTGFLDSLETREKADNHYGNSYAWSTLESSLGARTSVRTMISASLTTRSRDGYELYVFNTTPQYALTNDRDFSVFSFKQDWTRAMADAYILTAGVDARQLDNKDRFTSTVGADPNDPAADPGGVYPVTTQSSIKNSGNQLGAYVSNRIRVAEPLILEVGVRYDQASYTGDEDFSPRTGLALSLGGGRTLRAGWGYYRQMQRIDEVATLNNDNRYYSAERSEQWTASLEQAFGTGGLLRLEAYYKEGTNLRPVYRNWKNGVDTFPETNEDRILVHPTSTTGKGIELSWDRRFGKRFTTRAGYSYAIADETVERIESVNTAWPVTFDPTHPNPMDQRHAANVDFTYRPRPLWSLNGSLAFHSGWPSTVEKLVPVVDEDGEPDTAVRPEKIYGSRLPDYFRFDVRATRKRTTAHGEFRFFVELVNVTNHANVFGYDYFRKPSGPNTVVLASEEETWFSLLPSLGVSWHGSF